MMVQRKRLSNSIGRTSRVVVVESTSMKCVSVFWVCVAMLPKPLSRIGEMKDGPKEGGTFADDHFVKDGDERRDILLSIVRGNIA